MKTRKTPARLRVRVTPAATITVADVAGFRLNVIGYLAAVDMAEQLAELAKASFRSCLKFTLQAVGSYEAAAKLTQAEQAKLVALMKATVDALAGKRGGKTAAEKLRIWTPNAELDPDSIKKLIEPTALGAEALDRAGMIWRP